MSALMEHFYQSVMWAGIIMTHRWCAMTSMAVTTVSNLPVNIHSHTKYSVFIHHWIVGEVYPSFHLFPSSSFLAQEFMCNGTEEYSLTQCSYKPVTSQECFVGNRSAAVVCRQCMYYLLYYHFSEQHYKPWPLLGLFQCAMRETCGWLIEAWRQQIMVVYAQLVEWSRCVSTESMAMFVLMTGTTEKLKWCAEV